MTKRLFPIVKKTFIRNKTMTKIESGRSMVEMLGVLAIIGVLSIGGIAGYTMAMNRYRANEIIDTASKLSVVAQTQSANPNGTAFDASKVNLNTIGISANNVHNATFTAAENGQITLGGDMTSGVKNALKSITGRDNGDSIVIEGSN